MASIAVGAVTKQVKLPPREAPRLLPLDGVRGLAILLVFFFHYAGGLRSSSPGGEVLSAIFGVGWCGVDLFFVLSGFLITGILYDAIGKQNYFKTFYVRRVLRIFPIYYLFVVIAFAVGALTHAHWQLGHLFFLTYLGYPAALVWPSLTAAPVYVTHLWSLSVEEQFYTVWPWLIAKLKSPTTIVKACTAVAAGALVLRITFVAFGNTMWPYAFVFCRADELAIGAIIAILLRGPKANTVRRAAPYLFVSGLLAFCGLAALQHSVDHFGKWIASLGFTCLGVCFGGLLLLCLGPLAKIFSVRGLRVFGKYSYGFYLYHFPLLVLIGPRKAAFVLRLHSQAIGSVSYILFALLLNLGIAMASFHLFESPILRLKARFAYA